MADDDIIRGGLDIVTDKKNKTFNKRKNRALLTVRRSQNATKYLATTFCEKKHYLETVKIGNNRECAIQSWRSAWVLRDFISHSLHSVVV